MIDQSTFDGLAFPTAKVRYTSNGYAATLFRNGVSFRARASFDHAIGGGARGALPVALKAFDKALADSDMGLSADGDYVAIPGDLDNNFYIFTFVPKRFFGDA